MPPLLNLTSEEPRYGFVGPKGEFLVPCVYSEEKAWDELMLRSQVDAVKTEE